MATLTRTYRWERHAPDIGDNLLLPEEERLHLRIASGLTAERLQQVADGFGELGRSHTESKEERVELWLRIFGGLVEVDGTHTIDGREVSTLKQYLEVVLDCAGVYEMSELSTVLTEYNSISGTQQLFSRRHSGGLLTTRAQDVVKDSAQTAGR